MNLIDYNTDLYAWRKQTALLLRQGKLAEIDINHIAEEFDAMGGSLKREFMSRLVILIAHLLKWKFQPQYRGKSWKCTITEQREEIIALVEENPSLKYEIEKKFLHAYKRALNLAVGETKLDEKVFPQTCPFTLDQCLDETFFPES